MLRPALVIIARLYSHIYTVYMELAPPSPPPVPWLAAALRQLRRHRVDSQALLTLTTITVVRSPVTLWCRLFSHHVHFHLASFLISCSYGMHTSPHLYRTGGLAFPFQVNFHRLLPPNKTRSRERRTNNPGKGTTVEIIQHIIFPFS